MRPGWDRAARAGAAFGVAYSLVSLSLWGLVWVSLRMDPLWLAERVGRVFPSLGYSNIDEWAMFALLFALAFCAGLIAAGVFRRRGEPYVWSRSALLSAVAIPMTFPMLAASVVLGPLGFVWAPIAPWVRRNYPLAGRLAWTLLALAAMWATKVMALDAQDEGQALALAVMVAANPAAIALLLFFAETFSVRAESAAIAAENPPAAPAATAAATQVPASPSAAPLATGAVPLAEPVVPAPSWRTVSGVAAMCCAATALAPVAYDVFDGMDRMVIAMWAMFLFAVAVSAVAGWFFPLSWRTVAAAVVGAVLGVPLGLVLRWMMFSAQGMIVEWRGLQHLFDFTPQDVAFVVIVVVSFVLTATFRRYAAPAGTGGRAGSS